MVNITSSARHRKPMLFGVNRIGVDGNDIVYSGASAIYNGLGNSVLKMDDQEAVQTRKLSYADLEQLRIQLPFLKDRK